MIKTFFVFFCIGAAGMTLVLTLNAINPSPQEQFSKRHVALQIFCPDDPRCHH